MRIIVRRNRNDDGWVYVVHSRMVVCGDDLCGALLKVHHDYADAEVWLDDRPHIKLGNGLVFPSGDENLLPVEYVA